MDFFHEGLCVCLLFVFLSCVPDVDLVTLAKRNCGWCQFLRKCRVGRIVFIPVLERETAPYPSPHGWSCRL